MFDYDFDDTSWAEPEAEGDRPDDPQNVVVVALADWIKKGGRNESKY